MENLRSAHVDDADLDLANAITDALDLRISQARELIEISGDHMESIEGLIYLGELDERVEDFLRGIC